jgi:hypothetical protein
MTRSWMKGLCFFNITDQRPVLLPWTQNLCNGLGLGKRSRPCPINFQSPSDQDCIPNGSIEVVDDNAFFKPVYT